MNLDVRARDAAASARAAVAHVGPAPFRIPPGRPLLRPAILAGVGLVLVVGFVLAMAGENVTTVFTSPDHSQPGGRLPGPPPPMPDPGPAGPLATPFASGRASDGREWALFIGGPSNDICFGLDTGPSSAASACAGGPAGLPAPDPYRPLLFNDTRYAWFVFGRMPEGVTEVAAVFEGGRTSGRLAVISAQGGPFYAIEVPQKQTPVAVVGFRPDGTTVRFER